MIKNNMNKIFTERELKVIEKKLSNKELSQVDSNYLYKFIRPKLKEMSKINAEHLLEKMKYHQKARHIEEKITKTIRGGLDAKAIVLYGSVVQTNYNEYNDIDILIISKKEINPIKEKYKIINKIKEKLSKNSINGDIEIYEEREFKKLYPSSPSLIYQLKDSKLIYGKLEIPNKLNLYNTHLHMKLDWSYLDENPKGREIYNALRNVILVRLLLNKIVDNNKLNSSLENELGKKIIDNLRDNKETKVQRKIALMILKELENNVRKELGRPSWEKIEL